MQFRYYTKISFEFNLTTFEPVRQKSSALGPENGNKKTFEQTVFPSRSRCTPLSSQKIEMK